MHATAIAWFWERMTAIFGHRWSSTYGLVPEGACRDEWEQALAAMSRDQINRALLTCRARCDGFAPIPAEFRAWGFGFPAVEDVRNELADRSGAPRSPFAVAVGRRLDLWTYLHADSRTADRMLREACAAVREAMMRGEELPEPALELPAPAPEQRTFTPGAAREWLAQIEAELSEAEAARKAKAALDAEAAPAEMTWDRFVRVWRARGQQPDLGRLADGAPWLRTMPGPAEADLVAMLGEDRP